jgi:hypothetical protein
MSPLELWIVTRNSGPMTAAVAQPRPYLLAAAGNRDELEALSKQAPSGQRSSSLRPAMAAWR